jgi:toxin ParE1/3/4
MTRPYPVIFTPGAKRHLCALYAYIADHSGEAQANSYIDRIVTKCLSLNSLPVLSTRHDDIRPNLHTKSHGQGAAFAFSVNAAASTIVIYGIFYGGRDFERALRVIDTNAQSASTPAP